MWFDKLKEIKTIQTIQQTDNSNLGEKLKANIENIYINDYKPSQKQYDLFENGIRIYSYSCADFPYLNDPIYSRFTWGSIMTKGIHEYWIEIDKFQGEFTKTNFESYIKNIIPVFYKLSKEKLIEQLKTETFSIEDKIFYWDKETIKNDLKLYAKLLKQGTRLQWNLQWITHSDDWDTYWIDFYLKKDKVGDFEYKFYCGYINYDWRYDTKKIYGTTITWTFNYTTVSYDELCSEFDNIFKKFIEIK